MQADAVQRLREQARNNRFPRLYGVDSKHEVRESRVEEMREDAEDMPDTVVEQDGHTTVVA